MNVTLTCLWRLSLLFMAAIFGGDCSSVDLHNIGGSAIRRLPLALPNAFVIICPFHLFCVLLTYSRVRITFHRSLRVCVRPCLSTLGRNLAIAILCLSPPNHLMNAPLTLRRHSCDQ